MRVSNVRRRGEPDRRAPCGRRGVNRVPSFPVFVLRHGETEWNRATRMQGHLDSALTTLGRVQAARQGAIVRRHASGIAARVSPLGRARASAAMAGLNATPDMRLAEIGMGKWQGLTRDEIPETGAGGLLWKFGAPGGEGMGEVIERLDALLLDLSAPTILVTHGLVGIVLRGRLLGIPPEGWDAMTDPQGVVHRIEDGRETVLA